MTSASVVIVNYNGFGLLRNCIRSVQQHTHGVSYEIIVVDNGSTEGDIYEALSDFPGIKIIHNAVNQGFAKANNQGIAAAEGEYLLILNNDTLFHEDTLAILCNYAADKPNAIIGCKLLNADGTHQISICTKDSIGNSVGENLFLYKLLPDSPRFNKYYQNLLPATEPLQTDVVKGAFMFLRRGLMQSLGNFDEQFFFYAEETDLCYTAKKQGCPIIYFPGTAITHLGGATTELQPWFMFRNLHIAKVKLFSKQYSGAERFGLLALHYAGIFIRIWVYCLVGVILGRRQLLKKSWYYTRMLFLRTV